jgi:hypothetical protein
MWELICDHSYRWGKIAGDRSPWRPASDGFPSSGVSVAPDGAGLHFSNPQARIAIKQSKPWLTLGGVRVEVTARLASSRGFRIDGDAFSLHLQGVLLIGAGTGRDVLNNYFGAAAPPLDRWTRFTFEHNGFNKMALFIDDTPVASRAVASAVAGVGPKGVAIGNALNSDNGYLDGDIARVRVWRIDPKGMQKRFLARPLDQATARCWTDFINAINAALDRRPDCRSWLTNSVSGLRNSVWTALGNKTPDKLEEFRQYCLQYQALWRAGLLDHPAMKGLLAAFRDWLLKEGLIVPGDPFWQEFVDHRCLQLLLKELPPMECDPGLFALLRAIAGDDDGKAGSAAPDFATS